MQSYHFYKRKSTILFLRETQFHYFYNTANKKNLETNATIHGYHNKYKLGKPLSIGQKVLMGKSLNRRRKNQKITWIRIRSIYSIKTITNVNYEIRLDSDNNIKKAAHRNHLIENFPVEENATKLVNDYSLKQESYQHYKTQQPTQQKIVPKPYRNIWKFTEKS